MAARLRAASTNSAPVFYGAFVGTTSRSDPLPPCVQYEVSVGSLLSCTMYKCTVYAGTST